MTRLTLAVVLLVVGVGLRRAAAGDNDNPAPAPPDFAGKVVGVNFKTNDRFQAAILEKVSVRRLGTRDFLVGEYVGGDDEKEWKGTVFWLPLESIDNLMVFQSRAHAAKVTAARKKPDTD